MKNLSASEKIALKNVKKVVNKIVDDYLFGALISISETDDYLMMTNEEIFNDFKSVINQMSYNKEV
jgi:hypothetical protein